MASHVMFKCTTYGFNIRSVDIPTKVRAKTTRWGCMYQYIKIIESVQKHSISSELWK